MTGGDAIVRSLLRHGVDTLFGLPGVQTYALFDALARTPEIRVVVPRHEQACAATWPSAMRRPAIGKVGVYSVVPGPGVLNAAAALCVGLRRRARRSICLTGADAVGVHRRRAWGICTSCRTSWRRCAR